MSELQPFFELDGDCAIPSESTRGPWDPGSQHAGPPAALLGRAIERLPAPDDAEMRVGRITYEILRPVPIAPLRVETRIVRDGRRVQLVAASLYAGDEAVMSATAWRLRVEALELPAVPQVEAIPPGLEHAEPRPFFPTGQEIGYHQAVDYLFIEGGFLETGPAKVWMRTRVPVVAGEEPSPLQRVLVVADSGNGVSATLDWRKWLFINVDLSVHLHRYPQGEWVYLDAVTKPEPGGIGLADTLLADEGGAIGRSAQTLLVAPRPA
jgi:hypothetical protein